MKGNNENARKEVDNLKKGIDDFLVKYSNMLKKYRVDLLVSARRVVEKRNNSYTIKVYDIKQRQKEINQAIDTINKNMSVHHESPKFYTLKQIDVTELEAIRMGIKIMKSDLPKLLSKRNFTFPKEYERIAVKETGETIRKNFYLITQLKEEEITLLFSFLHSLYKDLPSIIKGKGGVLNGTKENGGESNN